MIFDRIEFSQEYAGLSPRLAAALEFLRGPDLADLPNGRHDLDADRLFALVQSYQTKHYDECRWEAHRRYIDVQFMLAGVEKIGVAPLAALKPVEPYSDERDVAFYSGDGDFLTLEAGCFAILFPHDAHMPQIASGAPAVVRKVVIKVAV